MGKAWIEQIQPEDSDIERTVSVISYVSIDNSNSS